MTVENVYILKNNVPCYGGLFCSHHEDVTWRYQPCEDNKLILFIVILSAIQILCDLLKVVKRNKRLKVKPKKGDRGKNVDSFWQKDISIYLLFVIQKTRFIQMKALQKDNLLFQFVYNDVNLTEMLNVSEEETLNKLPYWIVLPRFTRVQLLLLVVDINLHVPKIFCKTRNSICELLFLKYSEWEELLQNKNTDNDCLLQTFDNFQP